jgi:hypothetical protein
MMVVMLSEGDNKHSNQSAQRKTSCKYEIFDRFQSITTKRGKVLFQKIECNWLEDR